MRLRRPLTAAAGTATPRDYACYMPATFSRQMTAGWFLELAVTLMMS